MCEKIIFLENLGKNYEIQLIAITKAQIGHTFVVVVVSDCDIP